MKMGSWLYKSYHQFFDKISMTDATSGAGTTYT
jgi:hypothetical protein